MANINIYGKLYNNTVDKIIAGAEQIWDTTQSKMQDVINAELYDKSADIENQKGQPNGIAELDSSGKVPSSQLPSYVDDVLEYDNKSAFPGTGESGKIYIAKDTNLTYRWSGSAYVEISQSLALGETSSTAYAGDKGKANRDAINSLPSTLISSVSRGTIDGDSITINVNRATKSGINYGSPAAQNFDLPSATTSAAGLMSATDKSHANSLWSSALASIAVDAVTLATNTAGNQGTVTLKLTKVAGGEATNVPFNVTIPLATSSANGVMGAGDKAKLDGIGSISNQKIDEICV